MADKVFDENLRARLIAYQKATGLLADGVVAAKTWTKITEVGVAPATMATSEPAAQQSVQTEPTTEPTTTEAEQVPAGTAGAAPNLNFPMLLMIAQKCKDEAGVRAFLKDDLGFDLAAFERDIDAALTD